MGINSTEKVERLGDLDSYVDILLSPDTCSGGGWAKFIRLVRSRAHLQMMELEDDTDIC